MVLKPVILDKVHTAFLALKHFDLSVPSLFVNLLISIRDEAFSAETAGIRLLTGMYFQVMNQAIFEFEFFTTILVGALVAVVI